MGFIRIPSFGAADTSLPSSAVALTPAQRQMYKNEKANNFRWIAAALAKPSPTTLTPADMVSDDILSELKDIGQFAELTTSAVPLAFVFDNINTLTEDKFPLHGYTALKRGNLISAFESERAGVQIYLAHRPDTRQLIVAFSGTVKLKQVYYDICANMVPYPSSRPDCKCKVHSGFWSMYTSCKDRLLEEIRTNVEKLDVHDLVIAGHSMGGALAYLLALDLIAASEGDDPKLKLPLVLSMVSFGAPRCGNHWLAEHWNEMITSYRTKHGEGSLRELAIRGYNDGVPTLPPIWMGYRHFCLKPLYYVHGRLYRIPESEHEYSLFPVKQNEGDEPAEHPLGGHNYYNGRDMELAYRRMEWLEKALKEDKENWAEGYRKAVAKYEPL